jgi:arylsulfatase A-like enzyme
MFKRWSAFLVPFFVCSQICIGPGCAPDRQDNRPNMILVLVDALRRDHLGLYGYDKPTSPYLDSLAGSGLVFEDAWSQGSQTVFSTASLFTSQLFPPIAFAPISRLSSGITGSTEETAKTINVMVPIDLTFPTLLSETGYATAAFMNNPNHHRFSGFPDIFDEAFLLIDGEEFSTTDELPYADGATMVRRLTDWLAGREDPDQPFFVYLHLMDVHNPYRPPDEFRKRFVTTAGIDRYQNAVPTKEDLPSPADLKFMIESYDAEIAFADSLIKEVHEKAEVSSSRPLVLVVTSDHGDEFLDHGGLGHGRTLEMELLRVPLIVSGESIAPRNEKGLVRMVDVGPSLLEIAGVPIPSGWDGRPVFRSMPASETNIESVANYARLMSVTTTEWHAIWDRQADSIVLHDRLNDPEGLIDVAGDYPSVVTDFRQRFSELAKDRAEMRRGVRDMMDDLIRRMNAVEIREETEEQLRALGYVD